MANTPPSPVSSWTLDAQAVGGGGGACAAPALVWPGSTKSLTVQDASRGGTLHLKLAQENQVLQMWLEEASTKRQFSATLTMEECKAIVKDTGVEPSRLSEMLNEALSATGKEGEELSASFEWGTNVVTLILRLRYKWIAKAFHFPLEERDVGQVDRLERRMDDMLEQQAEYVAEFQACVADLKAEFEGKIQACVNDLRADQAENTARIQACVEDLKAEHTAKIQTCTDDLKADQARRDEEARRAELSCWSLHVSNPWEHGEGSNGHFAMSGNHFLIQDADHAKKTGVATHTTSAGFIQATFPKPVHVRTVKIAAFRRIYNAGISDRGSTVTLSVQSPETGEFETLRQDIPPTTQEEVFPVDKTILALRLSGTRISISTLIFS